MYNWEHGRVLAVFQILAILEGGGELESNSLPPQRLVANSAFLLKPGQWHRFRPDPKTGWVENWIEFQGLVPNALSGAGQLGDGMVVRLGVAEAGLTKALDAVTQRVSSTLPGIDPTLSALAMNALTAWNQLCQTERPSADLNQALSMAVQILNNEYKGAIDLEAVAKRVGMSYSVFRRVFRSHTGFAPWKYVQHMRLIQARHRLATSDDTLTKLADNLGFSSPFHLSTAFRKEFGLSPIQWRKIATRRPHAVSG